MRTSRYIAACSPPPLFISCHTDILPSKSTLYNISYSTRSMGVHSLLCCIVWIQAMSKPLNRNKNLPITPHLKACMLLLLCMIPGDGEVVEKIFGRYVLPRLNAKLNDITNVQSLKLIFWLETGVSGTNFCYTLCLRSYIQSKSTKIGLSLVSGSGKLAKVVCGVKMWPEKGSFRAASPYHLPM